MGKRGILGRHKEVDFGTKFKIKKFPGSWSVVLVTGFGKDTEIHHANTDSFPNALLLVTIALDRGVFLCYPGPGPFVGMLISRKRG